MCPGVAWCTRLQCSGCRGLGAMHAISINILFHCAAGKEAALSLIMVQQPQPAANNAKRHALSN